jgi:hypothetical protein
MRDPLRLPLSFYRILTSLDPYNLSVKPLVVVKQNLLLQGIISAAQLNFDAGEIFLIQHCPLLGIILLLDFYL